MPQPFLYHEQRFLRYAERRRVADTYDSGGTKRPSPAEWTSCSRKGDVPRLRYAGDVMNLKVVWSHACFRGGQVESTIAT